MTQESKVMHEMRSAPWHHVMYIRKDDLRVLSPAIGKEAIDKCIRNVLTATSAR